MEKILQLKEKVQKKLKLYGLRPTRARIRIGHSISKATVYNTLNHFARSGLVSEVAVNPTRMYYDSTTLSHHHFYNVETGQLIDIPREELTVENIPKLPDNTQIEDLEIVIKIKNK